MISMEKSGALEMMRGVNLDSRIELANRQPGPHWSCVPAYSGQGRYGYRLYGGKGDSMEWEEITARRLEADTACIDVMFEALERSVLRGDADNDVVDDTPEIRNAEEMYVGQARQTIDCEVLTVNGGI